VTGPIVFADYRARSHLLVVGHVYTCRPERTTGETWARWSRTGEAKLDVVVERVEDLQGEPAPLSDYAHASGFDSADEWADAIVDYHGDLSGYIYRVDLRGFRSGGRSS
jgi:hypothetical protein